MARLILALPGSGKTTAARSGLLKDVDYGYLRRAYGGLTDSGHVPELSGIYLRMLYLCSKEGVVASNCPELLSSYISMGYDVTIVVPEDPNRRYEELLVRREGPPCSKEKYKEWYIEWCHLARETGIPLYKGDVEKLVQGTPKKSLAGSTLLPLCAIVDADMVASKRLWSVKSWRRFINAPTGDARYIATLADGALVVKVFADGSWTLKLWFGKDIENVVKHWSMVPDGVVDFLPDLTDKNVSV